MEIRLRNLNMEHNQIQKFYKTGCAFTSKGTLQNSAILKISQDTLNKIRKDKVHGNNSNDDINHSSGSADN